jgi:hypothetical protein
MTRIAVFVLLCWPLAASAWAQPFPGCSCVSDPVTETNTGTIASSVTVGGGAGLYNSQAGYLDSLSSTMGQNVSGSIQTDFPGEEVLPPNTVPIVIEHAEVLNEKTQAHATEATARQWGISAFVQEAAALIP